MPGQLPAPERPCSGYSAPVSSHLSHCTRPRRGQCATACPAPGRAPLTSNDPSGEVELDDASAEGRSHHAQGRQEATREHDGPAAKAVHAHAAEWACGGRGHRVGPSLSMLTERPGLAAGPGLAPPSPDAPHPCSADTPGAQGARVTLRRLPEQSTVYSEMSCTDSACARFGPVGSHGFWSGAPPELPCRHPEPGLQTPDAPAGPPLQAFLLACEALNRSCPR